MELLLAAFTVIRKPLVVVSGLPSTIHRCAVGDETLMRLDAGRNDGLKITGGGHQLGRLSGSHRDTDLPGLAGHLANAKTLDQADHLAVGFIGVVEDRVKLHEVFVGHGTGGTESPQGLLMDICRNISHNWISFC
jgi:hypothetical protein